MITVAIVGILIIVVLVLVVYNIKINKKIQKFKNINQKITNLQVVQDFMSTIGEATSVDEKIKKINDILIEKYEIKYSTIVVFNGAEYEVKASNVDKKHWDSLKALQDVDMFKDSIEKATPKYVTVNNEKERLPYQQMEFGRAKSAIFFPLYIDNVYIGYWIMESGTPHDFDNVDITILEVIKDNRGCLGLIGLDGIGILEDALVQPLLDHSVLRRNDHVGGTKQGVTAGGVHGQGIACGGAEVDLCAVAAADPVLLLGGNALNVIQTVQTIDQLIGISGDLEHPLALDAVNDFAAAALAHAVDNFLVGQHALAAGAPVDVHFLLVSQTMLIQLQEDPLGPLVVLGVGGIDLTIPVKGEAQSLQLAAEVVHIVLGDNGRVDVVLHGKVLSENFEMEQSSRLDETDIPSGCSFCQGDGKMNELTISLDPHRKTPLYEQIYGFIREEIRGGRIRAGERLPSARALSGYLCPSTGR